MEIDCPSGPEQADLVQELQLAHSEPTFEKEKFFIVDSSWYYNWNTFVEASKRTGSGRLKKRKENVPQIDAKSLPASLPGPINNRDLLDTEKGNGDMLKEFLVNGFDYEIVSEHEWVALKQWYGGGPEICRYAIRNDKGALEIEVYPYTLLVSIASVKHGSWDYTYERELHMSKSDTISALLSTLNRLFTEVYKEESRGEMINESRMFFAKFGDDFKPVALNTDGEGKLGETGWKESSTHIPRILLDIKGANGKWVTEVEKLPATKKGVVASLPYQSYEPGYYSESTKKNGKDGLKSLAPYFSRNAVSTIPTADFGNKKPSKQKGVCGFVNLGNTCYMNASLQSLSHIKSFTDIFLDDVYKSEFENQSAEMTDSVASILELMYDGKNSIITPGSFKSKLGKLNATFKGYRQHDAEEFVSFILHKLSDEMRRPHLDERTSPAMNSDSNSLTDIEKLENQSRSALLKYRQKNNSLILDVFEGQYVSRLQCSHCDTASNTFEPFVVLSLAIPETNSMSLTINLENCLDEFLKTETLKETERWYCSQCNVSLKNIM